MTRQLAIIAAIVVGGLIAYGIFTNWIQPKLSAAGAAITTPDCLYAVDVGAAGAGRVVFSNDGRYLEISSNQRHSILNADTGEEVCDYAKGKQRASTFAFSADGNQIAYTDGSIIRVKSVDGDPITEIDISQDGKVSVLGKTAFLPSLNGLIASCNQGFCVYKLNGQRVTHFPMAGSVRGLAVAPDGKTIFIADSTGTIQRMVAGDSADTIKAQSHQSYLANAKLNAKGTIFATLGRDHEDAAGDLELKIWDTERLTMRNTFKVGKNVTDFSVDRTGQVLLVSKSTGNATAYDINSFDVLKEWEMGRGINTASLSPSADRVCFGLSKTVTVVDRTTQENAVTGQRETIRNKKRIPLYSIKGQSVSPGVILMLESKLGTGSNAALEEPAQ